MTIDDDDRWIEQADGMRLGLCQHCNHPHLFLLDANGDPFAEIVLDEEMLPDLIDILQRALAERHVGTIS